MEKMIKQFLETYSDVVTSDGTFITEELSPTYTELLKYKCFQNFIDITIKDYYECLPITAKDPDLNPAENLLNFFKGRSSVLLHIDKTDLSVTEIEQCVDALNHRLQENNYPAFALIPASTPLNTSRVWLSPQILAEAINIIENVYPTVELHTYVNYAIKNKGALNVCIDSASQL